MALMLVFNKCLPLCTLITEQNFVIVFPYMFMQQLYNTTMEALSTFRPLPPEPMVSVNYSKSEHTLLLLPLLPIKGQLY